MTMGSVRNGPLFYRSYQELSLLSSLILFPTWLAMISFHYQRLGRVMLVLQTNFLMLSLETRLYYQQPSSVVQASVHKTPPPMGEDRTYGLFNDSKLHVFIVRCTCSLFYLEMNFTKNSVA